MSTGKTHARHRGIISKHFVFDNLRSIFPIFTGRAQALAQAWSRLPEGTEVEVRAHGLCLLAASVDWVSVNCLLAASVGWVCVSCLLAASVESLTGCVWSLRALTGCVLTACSLRALTVCVCELFARCER